MRRYIAVLSLLCLAASLAGCSSGGETITPAESQPATAPYVEVVEEGMVPVYAATLREGTYEVKVDSSSEMFQVKKCLLTVENGTMTARMTMGGKGYLHVYPGTAEAAAAAPKTDYIPFEEQDDLHSFTIPVEALDCGIPCAAFSKKKETWYDRTLVFRSDSLPAEAFGDPVTAESLGLSEGSYTVEVTLSGGSGKASVVSPATLTVQDGKATAELIWNSNKYDYMIVDGEKFLPVSMEEHSVFEIPVAYFDRKIAVSADTIAMSEPHEIEYTLCFLSGSIQ